MSPVLFISLPFILLFLTSQIAGSKKPPKSGGSNDSEFQDGDIIIIRRKSGKK